MSKNSEIILHAIYSLESQNQNINTQTLKLNLKLLDDSISLELELNKLINEGYITMQNSIIMLTDYGKLQAADVHKTLVQSEFNNKIRRLASSTAYLDYCEKVYGYRLYLFNMMDKEQIDFVLNSIPISSSDTILDLGCGYASILNALFEKYKCKPIGIDLLDEDIIVKRNTSVTYIKDDIDKISDYEINPTITLSIDSLYFSGDLEKLINQLYSIGNNKMYLFYSQYIFDEDFEDKSILKSNNTKLARILNGNHIPYKIIEYSENERKLYENSLIALENCKQDFINEGNKDLLLQKLKEDTFGLNLYNKGLASRYLYIIGV